MIKIFLIVCLLLSILEAEDLHNLLAGYKQDAELSKITKRDSAGLVEVFTRNDLEKMQVRTLEDVLKVVPGIYLRRSVNNLSLGVPPSENSAPVSFSRLYINNHDVTSSSFGSAALFWGKMPIEYIDHIEIYEATSSMEFGNENAAFIVRLYTKKALRENGSKVALGVNNLGSSDLNVYTAQVTNNDFSYFAFGHFNDTQRKKYQTVYNNHLYEYKSGNKGYNAYGDIQYKKWRFELNLYQKDEDGFIGIGTHKTPDGNGGLNGKSGYLHISRKFANDFTLQLAYDKLDYKRTYSDSNGIQATNMPIINHYGLDFDDDIYSIILEKRFKTQNNSLLLGGFYKYKAFEANGEFYDLNQSYYHANNYSNALALSSLYLEDKYDISRNLQLIGSLKEDFHHYEKEVKSQNEFLLRAGFIYKKREYKLKAFYSNGYTPLAFYQIYNPENIPYKANPQLDPTKVDLYSCALKREMKKQEITFKFLYARTRSALVVYDRTTANGWINISAPSYLSFYELHYTYNFDLQNKLKVIATYAVNNEHKNTSPAYNVIASGLNTYKKFDFYNSLNYKSSYTSSYGPYVKSSVEVTSAVKYHYTQDFSIGIKGENIFNSARRSRYKGVGYGIPYTQQNFWCNLEYLF